MSAWQDVIVGIVINWPVFIGGLVASHRRTARKLDQVTGTQTGQIKTIADEQTGDIRTLTAEQTRAIRAITEQQTEILLPAAGAAAQVRSTEGEPS